jgi:hypothetical protein
MKFRLTAGIKGEYVMTDAWAGVAINTWYELRFVRNGATGLIMIQGVSQALTESTAFGANDVGVVAGALIIGAQNSASYLAGWVGSIVIAKGATRHTATYTPRLSPECYKYLPITHNLNSAAVNVAVLNNKYQKIIPDDFVIVGVNSAEIDVSSEPAFVGNRVVMILG